MVWTYPFEKYELVSWGDDIPNIWRNETHVPVTTNQLFFKNLCPLSVYHQFTLRQSTSGDLCGKSPHQYSGALLGSHHRTIAGGFCSHGADCRRRPWMRIEPTINGNFRILNIGLIYGRYLQFRILEWPLKPKLRFKWSWYLVGGLTTCFNHLEKWFWVKVNGKDDIPYIVENKNMFETTNQIWFNWQKWGYWQHGIAIEWGWVGVVSQCLK